MKVKTVILTIDNKKRILTSNSDKNIKARANSFVNFEGDCLFYSSAQLDHFIHKLSRISFCELIILESPMPQTSTNCSIARSATRLKMICPCQCILIQ